MISIDLGRPMLVAAAVLGRRSRGRGGSLNGLSDVVTGGYYAYAVPEDPAHPRAAWEQRHQLRPKPGNCSLIMCGRLVSRPVG
jgi:hypothetical protein